MATKVTVEAVMRRNLITTTPHETLAAAQELMDQHGVRQLPVVDGERLIAMLSERDLHAHTGYLQRTKVDAAMSENPLTVGPGEAAERVAQLLLDHTINALPVVDGGRLVGIVSRSDLLRVLIDLLTRSP